VHLKAGPVVFGRAGLLGKSSTPLPSPAATERKNPASRMKD
jgi:hypothetical protein